MKIAVLEADSVGRDVSWDGLKQYGEVALYSATPDELVAERIKDADIVIPNKAKLTADVLSEADHLRLICEAATGYNNIDTDYCREHGIPVTNVRNYSTDIVAQHTFAMLLSLYDRLDYYSTYVEDGDYSRGRAFSNVSRPFHELAGSTYGIIGLGNIGRKVAQIATAFGADVIYYSASGHDQDVPYRRVDLDTLLSESDVVSIHAPLNEKTKGLIGREEFHRMKHTAVLINVARGPVVVESELARAINDCEISAAGIDVYEVEPLPKDSPLLLVRDRDRLLLTPHVAWGSVEARKRLVQDVCLSIESFLAGGDRSRVV